MEEYSWNLKGLANGVNPSVAADELKRIKDVYGKVTPDIIVKESEKNDSPLHPIFEWSDKKAAYHYRLQQARTMLNNLQVKVISSGEEKRISAYEVTSVSGGYKSIETFDPNDIQYVKNSIKAELTYLKNKLELYKELEKSKMFISQAIEALN